MDFAGVGSSALDVSEVGIAAEVNSAESPSPIAALNRVLSEVIDVVQDVKQAQWRLSGAHDLHAVLRDLFDDLKSWALLLMEERLTVSRVLKARGQRRRDRLRFRLEPGALSTTSHKDPRGRAIAGVHAPRGAAHCAVVSTGGVRMPRRGALGPPFVADRCGALHLDHVHDS